MLDVIALVIAMLGSAIGGYVAIRTDLARLHAKIDGASEAAKSAHSRIDGILMKGPNHA